MTQIQPLVIESENFSFDTISIIVHWEQQDNVLYSPSISPGGEATVRVIGSTRVQARVAYNTQYNLSIIGSFCGQNVTNVIKLHYGECAWHSTIFLCIWYFLCVYQLGAISLAIF